ncbi:MAG: tetratricopeptide repeat protein [Blastocatellia bacterium]
MLTNIRLLFSLLWHPFTGIRAVRDRAPVGFAVVVALLAAWMYSIVAVAMAGYAQAGGGIGAAEAGGQSFWMAALVGNSVRAFKTALMIVLFTAVVFTPFLIFVANLFERRASFSLVIREEYPAMVSCALMGLALAFWVTLLPAIVIGWQSSKQSAALGFFVMVAVIPLPVFAWFVSIATGSIFNVSWITCSLATLIAFVSMLTLPLFIDATSFVCGSPFLLLILVFLLRDRVDDFMRSHQARQSFRQNLQAATLNPADASAHYNLGLLYQQRGELEDAARSFRRAVEIDPTETDAHYQLGRIARSQNRPDEAIQRFEQVIQQDAAHSHHEIWRETALVYYSAKQYPDALVMFEKFVEHRPSDAQGRYWLGMTLHSLGRTAEAIEEMNACIESVKTAPAYKYRTERQWLHLAQSFLREHNS